MSVFFVRTNVKTILDKSKPKFVFLSKKVLTFASMEMQMTLAAAWRHFIDNLEELNLKRLEKNEVRQAQRDAKRGLLADERIGRLLLKYGQGRYRIETQTVVFVK